MVVDRTIIRGKPRGHTIRKVVVNLGHDVRDSELTSAWWGNTRDEERWLFLAGGFWRLFRTHCDRRVS